MADVRLLERQKSEFLKAFDGWSVLRLNHRPAPAEWSAIEMLDHVVKVEVGILAAAVEGLKSPHRISLSDRIRTRLLLRLFLTERRVKVPTGASQILPGADLDFDAIVLRWQQGREDLRAFVDKRQQEELCRGLFRHPVGGWMGLPQILDFFSVHMIHHRFQLSRIRDASSFVDEPGLSVQSGR